MKNVIIYNRSFPRQKICALSLSDESIDGIFELSTKLNTEYGNGGLGIPDIEIEENKTDNISKDGSTLIETSSAVN